MLALYFCFVFFILPFQGRSAVLFSLSLCLQLCSLLSCCYSHILWSKEKTWKGELTEEETGGEQCLWVTQNHVTEGIFRSEQNSLRPTKIEKATKQSFLIVDIKNITL